MSHFDHFLSLVRREVLRTIRKYHKPPRVGLVSSYDKTKHAVKVQYQPEGSESGWIPLTGFAIGNKFGILSAPNIKDQVRVDHQEGEHMVGQVVTRYFSSMDQPPQLDAGEHAIIHKTGSGTYWKQDGTVTHAGPGYYQVGQTGQGQSGHTTTGNQNGDTGQQIDQQQQTAVGGKQSLVFNTDGSTTLNVPDQNAQGSGTPQNPTLTVTAQKDITHTSQQGNITLTSSQGNITRSANQQISDSAQSISHNGNTTINPNLTVSQLTTSLNYTQSSDRRIKDNFCDFDSALEKALALKVQWFDLYPSDFVEGEIKRTGDAARTFGLIAQDVREIIPEIVRGSEDEQIITLDESKIGVLTLAALQEYVAKTNAEIAALKDRIDLLESWARWPI